MQTSLTTFSKSRTQRWLRIGSVLISFAAVTLLATAFGARLYRGSLSSVLLTIVLIALCIAIVLHVRFLLLARREHRETANALDRRFLVSLPKSSRSLWEQYPLASGCPNYKGRNGAEVMHIYVKWNSSGCGLLADASVIRA